VMVYFKDEIVCAQRYLMNGILKIKSEFFKSL
jgi:hypothetical protein